MTEKAKRRIFSAQFKRKLLEEIDRAQEGEIGAILRRHGVYSSSLAIWRRQREAGELEALSPKRRGPKVKARDARDREISDLQRKLSVTEARLKKAEAIIELQKKVSEILGIDLPKPPEEKS